MTSNAWRLASFVTAVWAAGGCTGEGAQPLVDTELPIDSPRGVDDDRPSFGDAGNVVVDPTPPDEPTQVGDGLEGNCVATANALRVRCVFDVDPPTGVEIAFRPIDRTRAERTQVSEDTLDQHSMMLLYLAADTEYEWRAERADGLGTLTGYFRTNPLPSQYPVMSTIGTSTTPMFGMQSPCGGSGDAVIHDPDGSLLWIQNMFGSTSGRIEGLDFTEDKTIVATGTGASSSSRLTEFDLEGNQLLDFVQGTDFDLRLHHDVFRSNGLTYALTHEVVMVGSRQVLLDGLYVFDSSRLIEEWWLSDHFVPAESSLPNTSAVNDYSHANAVWVSPTGEIFLSLRHMHSIVKLAPVGPDFGQVEWVLAGGPTSWTNDFTLIDLPGEREGFLRQHNFHQIGTGEFAMFDNRMGGNESSRLLRLDLDQTTFVFEALEAYELPNHCAFQGGAWSTIAGNPVGTCAPSRRAYEFELGQPGLGLEPATTVWEGQVTCVGGSSSYVPRFVPLDW